LKNGPGFRDPGIRDPGIAIPRWWPSNIFVSGFPNPVTLLWNIDTEYQTECKKIQKTDTDFRYRHRPINRVHACARIFPLRLRSTGSGTGSRLRLVVVVNLLLTLRFLNRCSLNIPRVYQLEAMAAPRKFSDKIALLTQKQIEGTAAFDAILREVSATTRVTLL